MGRYAIFTDVSLDPVRKLGMGACLVVESVTLGTPADRLDRQEISRRIMMKTFDNTSSTQLEIETALWAVGCFKAQSGGLVVDTLELYTDSQCVAGLPGRRQRLLDRGFKSRGNNSPLKNASLYRRFYELMDETGFSVVKVTGHSPSASHDTVRRLFSFIDREVRQAFRKLKDA